MAMLLLIAALAPVALMMHFVYVRDRYEREPIGRVALVFFVSCFTVIPAALFEVLFSGVESYGLVGIALSTFCVIAFSEELVKYWSLRLIAVPHNTFNEVYDGIIYGVAASLGFATVENIIYVFFSGGDGLLVALMRGILAVPGHALWGVMMGFYVGLAKFEADPVKQRRLVTTGVLIAIFWHGLYDFFAFAADYVDESLSLYFGLGVLAVIIVNWIIGIRLIRRAQSLSCFKRPNPLVNPVAAFNRQVKYCHQCGRAQPAANNYCQSCGYEFPD